METKIYSRETESITITLDYEIEIDDPNDFRYLLIPLGDLGESGGVEVDIQLITPTTSIQIWKRTVDEIIEPFTSYPRIRDGTGTTWLNISLNEFNLTHVNQFLIQHTLKRADCKASYYDSRANETFWLQPIKYIDSNHSTIIEIANDLIPVHSTRSKDVQTILDFVSTNVQYNESNHFNWSSNSTYTGEVNSSASDVLRIKKGVCRHFSRLYVAICRASGIPARYVEGYVVKEDKSIGAHAWAEYLDENHNWNVVEPQSTPFENYPISYFNIIHGPMQDSSFFVESVLRYDSVLVEDTEKIVVYEHPPYCVDYEINFLFSTEKIVEVIFYAFLCQFFFFLLLFFLIFEWFRVEKHEWTSKI